MCVVCVILDLMSTKIRHGPPTQSDYLVHSSKRALCHSQVPFTVHAVNLLACS